MGLVVVTALWGHSLVIHAGAGFRAAMICRKNEALGQAAAKAILTRCGGLGDPSAVVQKARRRSRMELNSAVA